MGGSGQGPCRCHTPSPGERGGGRSTGTALPPRSAQVVLGSPLPSLTLVLGPSVPSGQRCGSTGGRTRFLGPRRAALPLGYPVPCEGMEGGGGSYGTRVVGGGGSYHRTRRAICSGLGPAVCCVSPTAPRRTEGGKARLAAMLQGHNSGQCSREFLAVCSARTYNFVPPPPPHALAHHCLRSLCLPPPSHTHTLCDVRRSRSALKPGPSRRRGIPPSRPTPCSRTSMPHSRAPTGALCTWTCRRTSSSRSSSSWRPRRG